MESLDGCWNLRVSHPSSCFHSEVFVDTLQHTYSVLETGEASINY